MATLTRAQQKLLKDAQVQLAKKLRLERGLNSLMRGFFARQNREFLETWTRTRSIINAEMFRQELQVILKGHYSKASKQFRKIQVDSLNAAIENMPNTGDRQKLKKADSDNEELLALLALFALRESAKSASEITTTSNAEMRAAMEATDNDGLKAAAILRQRAMSRAQGIAVTENQKACEGTKQKVSESVAVIAPVLLLAGMKPEKTWMTQQDQKVRAPHQVALFQKVPVNRPFEVGGQLLMFPGDWSLGASAWNIVNCRCTAIHEYSFF